MKDVWQVHISMAFCPGWWNPCHASECRVVIDPVQCMPNMQPPFQEWSCVDWVLPLNGNCLKLTLCSMDLGAEWETLLFCPSGRVLSKGAVPREFVFLATSVWGGLSISWTVIRKDGRITWFQHCSSFYYQKHSCISCLFMCYMPKGNFQAL